jgi:Protein of unknown function (DUF3445)
VNGSTSTDQHKPNTICQDHEKLHTSLGRFFKRLPVDKPVIRNNYTFQIVTPPTQEANPDKLADPGELSWAASMIGSEDQTPPHHTSTGHFDWDNKSQPPLTAEMMKLRTERQTLRRLPKTKAIVFTIRTYTTPVEMLVKEPGVPGRLASAVRSWPGAVARCVYISLTDSSCQCPINCDPVTKAVISLKGFYWNI